MTNLLPLNGARYSEHKEFKGDLSAVPVSERPRILSTADIAENFFSIAEFEREAMVAGAVDAQGSLVAWEMVALGAIDHLIVRVGDVFRGAMKSGGCSVFLVHNHPTGSLEPSAEDIELTHAVANAGLFLGIPLTDHVIVSINGAFSIMYPQNLRRSGSRVVRPQFQLGASGQLALTWNCGACKASNVEKNLTHVRAVLKGLTTPFQCRSCEARAWACTGKAATPAARAVSADALRAESVAGRD
jgi:hypothetical protein